MPTELKVRVDAVAAKNGRSLNAEIVARLKENFETQSNIALPSLSAGGIARTLAILTDDEIARLTVRLAARLKAI